MSKKRHKWLQLDASIDAGEGMRIEMKCACCDVEQASRVGAKGGITIFYRGGGFRRWTERVMPSCTLEEAVRQ